MERETLGAGIDIVRGRIGALGTLLFGVGDHPEQVDVGPWRWSARTGGRIGPVAVWRHEDDWNRTVEVTPAHYTQVTVDFPDGSQSDWYDDESEAIELAIEWMREHE